MMRHQVRREREKPYSEGQFGLLSFVIIRRFDTDFRGEAEKDEGQGLRPPLGHRSPPVSTTVAATT